MARYLGNIDSSDDDFSDNLQLAERLRINRVKFRKKNFLDDQSSSSSSLEMQSGDVQNDRSARTYNAFTKKRQNGDKNVELFANPKRTCLSNRFLKSHDNQNKKKSRTERYQNPDFPCSSSENTNKHIFADKTYEDHLHNLVDEEDTVFNSKQVSKRKFVNCLNDRPKEELACVKPKLSVISKQPNDQIKQINKSSPTSPKHFLWRDSPNNLSEPSKSGTSGVRPSAFVPSQRPDISRVSPSDGSIVYYVDSASDEDSRPMIKSGSLKGGRQSPELSQSNKKVIGRKVKKKVLDSDIDSDGEAWPIKNRPLPRIIFSSSDSEAESSRKVVDKPSPLTESSNPYLFPVIPAFENGVARNNESHIYPRDNSAAGPSSSLLSFSKGCRSFRNRKQIKTNGTSEISPNSFHSNNVARRGRSRVNLGERYTRRTGSPHPRTLPNSHSRITREVTKGRSLTGSQTRKANLNLATIYPDLFDADDSSEIEFFTANSYSDTETSAESFGGLTISSTVRSPNRNRMICEHSINIGSSEDDISVVFSSRPGNVEIERQVNRSAEPRRTLGRRRQRGSWRHHRDPVQEVVSLSPDPVEQVRQVEDDERFARNLQAQFDAEADPDYQMHARVFHLPENNPFTSDSPPERGEEGDGWIPILPPAIGQYVRGHRLNRAPHRHASPTYMGNMFYNTRRAAERNSRNITINQLFQPPNITIHQLFPPPNMLDDFFFEDSFEAFLGLADLNGDVPRGLQKSEVNRLPTRQYLTASNNAGSSSELPHKRAGLNKECQVCLSDYENGDILRILPCFHEFHTPCIDPWLKINNTCPVCRVVVDLEG